MTFTCTVCKATKTETIPALTNNTYTATFNANGGMGALADHVKEQGKTLTLSSAKPQQLVRLLNDQGETGVSVACKFIFADEFKNICQQYGVVHS